MGIEPTTLCLASIRSSQLSYTRMVLCTNVKGLFCQFDVASNLAFEQAEKLQVIVDARPYAEKG